MNRIEITNEAGQTISTIEAELDALNAEFLTLMQSPPEPGKLPVVQAAGIAERATALVSSREDLQQRQQTLDTYREIMEQQTAGVIQRRRLSALLDRVTLLHGHIRDAMQPLPSTTQHSVFRDACVKGGVPDSAIKQVDYQANEYIRQAEAAGEVEHV